jgi:hypothetical protein
MTKFVCAEPGCVWKPKYLESTTGELLCGVHARTRQLAAADATRIDTALHAAGARVDITEDPQVQRIQALLEEHQLTCQPCQAERLYTVREMAEGRVTTEEDVKRVGQHAIDHACAYGGRLRMALGLAMLGRPAPIPTADS